MGKTPSIKYETPAPDSPVGESRRDKETPKDPAKAGPTGQGETPKDPAKAGPTGQGEGERVIRAPQFLFLKVYLFFNLSNNIFIFS